MRARRVRRPHPLWVALMLAVALSPAMLFAREQAPAPGPRWWMHYYANEALMGRPRRHPVRHAQFDWGHRRPLRALPADGFSTRIETCVYVPTERQVALMVTADDGVRIKVDGMVYVDDWEARGRRTRGAWIPMRAGMRLISVEHVDRGGPASLHVYGSLRGEIPGPLRQNTIQLPKVRPWNRCGRI